MGADVVAAPDGSARGVRCQFQEARLEVVFKAANLLHVRWGVHEGPLGSDVPADAQVAVEVEELATPAGGWQVSSSSLRVTIRPDGSLVVRDRAGRLLHEDLAPLRRAGMRVARRRLRPGERLCGLGEQAGPVDLAGTSHRIWNRDPGGSWGSGHDPLYCPWPLFVGLHPDGDVLVAFDNPAEATVRVGDGSGPLPVLEAAFASGEVRYYLVAGSLAQLLEGFSALSGRAPLPPRWALGYHQCRWGYRSQAEIEEVAAGFAAEKLPLSAIHLDIDYMDGYRVFTVNRTRFPDLGTLTTRLAARGTRVVTIVDPAVKVDQDYEVFRSGIAGGHFVAMPDGRPWVGAVWPGAAAFPDFTAPATRAWWASYYAGLVEAGVAGAWHDMNEPTSIAWWGDRTLPRRALHDLEGRGGDHGEAHNIYGLFMNQAGFEGLATAAPGRRPFVLSRAGWAGGQRWAWNWTGDVDSTWAGLRQQVATAVSLGLSGLPYTGSDTGGFSGAPSPELYVRWLEMSVLMPFCRTHSALGVPRREPWQWPAPYRVAVGRLVRFRYRLLPYLYTLASQAADDGHPLVRPLFWPSPAPPAGEPEEAHRSAHLWGVDDAYLLGDQILVAPVTVPGATGRSVPLPAGTWYHCRLLPPLGTKEPQPHVGFQVLQGGAVVQVDTPIGQAPLFVRAGSVIPLDDGWADPTGGSPDPTDPTADPTDPTASSEGVLDPSHAPRLLALHCFVDPSGRAMGALYDDAGDGWGARRHDTFSVEVAGESPNEDPTVRVTWTSTGSFPRPDRVRVVLYGLDVRAAVAHGAPVPLHRARVSGTVATILDCPEFAELRGTLVPREVGSGDVA